LIPWRKDPSRDEHEGLVLALYSRDIQEPVA
jgi:hypothetical protein